MILGESILGSVYLGSQLTIPEYYVYADWQGLGHYEQVNSNITADVKSIPAISRGRDNDVGRASPGACEIRVRNDDNKYSRYNTSSPVYGCIKPGIEIYVLVVFGFEKKLFRGRIKEITPHPGWESRDCYIKCLDDIKLLEKNTIVTPLFENEHTGYLIGQILDYGGWDTARRLLDEGVDDYPYAWWTRATAQAAIDMLAETERGFFWGDGAGNARWEDRQHRIKGEKLTSRFLLSDVEHSFGTNYDFNDDNVINDVSVSFIPRVVAALGDIWQDTEVTCLAAGATVVKQAKYSSIAKGVISPVVTTDYTANSEASGMGTDKSDKVTLSFTSYAEGAGISLTNNDTGAIYITLLKIRGQLVTAGNAVDKLSSDTGSQEAFGKRTYNNTYGLLSSSLLAGALADYIKDTEKDARILNIPVNIMNKNIETWKQIIQRDISDRVTLYHPDLNINQDYFINKIEHRIDQAGLQHTVSWWLEEALAAVEYFMLDVSELDSDAEIAY